MRKKLIKKIRRVTNSNISGYKELDRLKDEFISIISHELHTPMAVIREGVALVVEGAAGTINERQREILATVKKNTLRLSAVINNLLDVSRLHANKFYLHKSEFDLVELLKQTVDSFKDTVEQKKIMLTFLPAYFPMMVHADKERLNRVINNILDNAIKFTEKGYIKIILEKNKNQIKCIIEDTGIGLPQKALTEIFGRFRQFGLRQKSGEKGVGLGLSFVKGIVELHGGNVRVESRQGKGTRFIFTLPTKS